MSFTLYSLGLAPVFTLATDMIVGSVRPERAGAASAISETGSELGGALGIAVLGSLGTAVYRREMAAAAVDMPHRVLESAQRTLGAAIAEAQLLPGDVAAHLTTLARDTFTTALQFAAGGSGVIVLGRPCE